MTATDDRALPDITVRAALELPALRRGLPEVLAGHARLDQTIRWVHTGEVANIAALLSGGEMLLTTGMGIGTRAAEQRRFVARLAERDAAALVIELGTVFSAAPRALVEAAEQAQLPLIVLRNEIPFVAVTEAVHTQLVSSHYALLRRGELIQRELTELLLEGEGIPAVLAALASTLQAPVFLEDARGRLLSHALPGGDADMVDPLDAWEMARRGGVAPGGRAAAVRTGGRGDGRLLVAPLRAPYDALAGVALEPAAGIVALALLRERQEEELAARERGSLLVDLADGRIAPGAVGRAALAAGLERVPALLLPLAALVGDGSEHLGGDWDAALRDAERQLSARGWDAVVGRRSSSATLLVLVALRDADQRAAAADAVAAVLHEVLGRRLGIERVTVAAGRASELSAAGPELRRGEQSAAAIAASGASSGDGGAAGERAGGSEDDGAASGERAWHDVKALELRRLLWTARDDADLTAMVERVLGPLVAHDRERRLVLLPTLEALIANGGRKAETARTLHLNRQALYHRLARIEQLLGVELSDPEQLLTLHVALLARQYAG
ncbi:PucR family transcriptional regulator [Conexibacter sp. CPCC 206217]|uniref:PucR family transcriptional regulator n=1 Tax=Conexibacter sp. CPCC 206217 TaxID=3064574 RepID=UPI00271BEAA7|nr:PucR family transcriptional regulator [Conexibacter sp. CPCC 206217]MDO8211219.1 PucR family transcriptional regulator [Conexibacter sp. CPCC 206217]